MSGTSGFDIPENVGTKVSELRRSHTMDLYPRFDYFFFPRPWENTLFPDYMVVTRHTHSISTTWNLSHNDIGYDPKVRDDLKEEAEKVGVPF
jgi:hypothetical protein